jgi:integrase
MKSAVDRGLYSHRLKTGALVWYVRAGSHGQMRHFGSFASKAEARAFYRRYKAEVLVGRAGIPGQESDRTVGELFAEYLPTVRHRRAYKDQVRFAAWWMARFPGRRVLSLTAQELNQAKVDLLHPAGSRARRAMTVNHYLKCLRHAMRVTVRPRSRVIDLWADVTMLEVSPPVPVVATPTEERQLYRQLAPIDRDRAQLGRFLGIRRGQLFGMRWERMQWKTWTYTLEQFKRQPERPLPIPSPARPILRRIWVAQGKPKRGWIFPSPDHPGKPLDANAWYRRHFVPAVTRAGLRGRKIVFHSLRHTWATRGLEAGVHPLTLQKMGGWSDRKQVERYAQVLDPTLRDGMERAAGGMRSRKLQIGKRRKSRK